MKLLDAASVEAGLAELHGWNGDTGRIARTVQVADARAEDLQVEIMRVADALDHHPVVERHGDALTFILWTHSAGGVTAKDLQLAARIDEIIDGDGAGTTQA